MTQEEIQIIIDSDLPSYEKSRLLQLLYDAKNANVKMFKRGGITKSDDEKFNEFLSTLPENLRTLSEDYDMKRFWELSGKPLTFEEGLNLNMFKEEDDGWQAMSVRENSDRGVIEFMKRKDHPTLYKEIEATANPEFMSKWIMVSDPERPGYFMYAPKEIIFNNLTDSLKIQQAIENAKLKFAEGGEMESKKYQEPDAVITVGTNTYKVCIADTPDKRKEGLSKCKHLPEDGGMLFVFEEPSTTYFTMAETSIDLDIIFIDEEGEVIEVHSVKANDSEPVECSEEYCYVLEVNYGSGITEGDEINLQNIDDDSDLDEDYTDEEKESISRSKMLVLNSNGDVLMKLVGGERIVSMIKTRLLIKAALKAYKSDNDSDYRRVGKLILTELNEQDSRDPLYVSKPE